MDIELNFVRRGKGENLIFLHGNGEDLTYFEKQIEFFSHDFCVYAIDTRGHGKSPWGEAPFTIRQFADDLMEFMNVHKIEKANIVGFSDGANIAMIFALKYPEKVDKLVLNGGNLNGGGVKAYVQLPVIIGYKFARMFAGKNSEAEKHALMLGLMVNDPNIAPEQLGGIRAKTLVIAGSRDTGSSAERFCGSGLLSKAGLPHDGGYRSDRAAGTVRRSLQADGTGGLFSSGWK